MTEPTAPVEPQAHAAAAPRRRAGALRWAGRALAALLALLALVLAGLWIWAGSAGSLATVLRWVGTQLPLQAEAVSGSVLGGGTIGRLAWNDGNGLHVEVEELVLHWTPRALLARTLQVEQLAARRIVIDDQRPAGEPTTAPPDAIALPLKLRVDALRVDELQWAGPPPQAVRDLTARYDYDGRRHALALEHAHFENGDYHARLQLTDRHPVTLDLALAGALTTAVPGSDEAAAFALRAGVQGPLADLQARADLQQLSLPTDAGAPALPPLPEFAQLAATPTAEADADAGAQARASARITPWAAQPLPEARLHLRALDLGALWAQAPATHLGGTLDLAPLAAADAAGGGWTLHAALENRQPGPWDQRQLPLEQMTADLDWQDGTATVRTLQALLAGGTLEASGRWVAPPSESTSATDDAGTAATPPWRLDARLHGIEPDRLHTQLQADPIDGTAQLGGQGEAIDFELELQARAPAAAPAPRQAPAGESAIDLRALRLRHASARGRWHDRQLELQQLRVRTDDAELAGTAALQLAGPGGTADLKLKLPGAELAVQGEAQPDRGAGTLRLALSDARQVLAWARRMPGLDAILASAEASGRATLDAHWRDGWRNPRLQARLASPGLELQLPAGDEPQAPIRVRALALDLDGRLDAARLDASGELAQGERTLQFQLQADGGRTGPASTPLAQAGWGARIARLQAEVAAPELGQGRWRLATEGGPVPLAWSPAEGGRFEAGAGALAITSPAPVSQARVAWEPLRWRAGELHSRGRLTGLPLQWAERLGGDTLREAGVTGDVVFDGAWDLALGSSLQVRAQLERTRGDLTLLATDGDTGVQSRVPAGLREARLELAGNGPELALRLAWDSAQAGSANGSLRTQLHATHNADGATHWDWPETAPLQGRLQAQLPQISAWSVLAPPGWRLRGSLGADVRLGGTRAAPLLDGTLGADNLALRSVVDGIALEHGRLRARLDGTRLLVDELTLEGAGPQGSGGRLRASGEAGWIDGRAQASLDARLERMRVSARSDREVDVSGQVQARLDGRAVEVDGQLQVDHARIVLPDENAPRMDDDVIVRGPDGRVMYGREGPGAVATPTSEAGQQLAAQQERSSAARARRDEPLTVRARVGIDLGPDFQLSGMGIATRLAGKLALSADGPLGRMPELKGTVRTVGGSFHAYGQQLAIEHGEIVFRGDPANPTLEIIALRPNYTSDQRVGVEVAGSALLPRVRLYSQPQLPDSQALAWLLLGREAPETGAESAMLQTAALALLGGREGRGLAATFGLDELSFSSGDGEVGSASVTLGKRLSDRLYAAYEHSVAGASGTLLIFYELSRRWSLRGQAGVDSAVDLIFRLSFD
ncbi:MAG TPA: translocation/assembly module TamB domain-containing protein [Ottowia sp.]|uniref:translocation/assembly module TamB domain-containing protein n=1 Tax=Ottowia sp. TaxID=1898956 RepID=UPI002CB60242|nr:translocation/assembly module TamB domain-containing protein [Ottowia sp.]HMN20257.1 translocation/assembly module TamB domain-containing protein [Ottowia sp.]